MELVIFREHDMWAARLGKYKAESLTTYPLVPASESLFRLVTALHNAYPGCKVWIDPNVTDNPFMSTRILTTRFSGLTPPYDQIQYALDNSEIKTCTLCGGRAYYNVDGRDWVCASSRCGAHEYRDGSYFKLSRHARR